MVKTDKTPMWVFLAFSSIETRQGALWLTGACALFSIYCLPWPLFFDSPGWIKEVFLINDWSWVAMMAPLTLWYWLSLKWVDKNLGWKKPEANS